MSAKVTYPTKSLLQGMKYTNAASTDLRARFRELMESAKKKPLPPVTLVRRNQK